MNIFSGLFTRIFQLVIVPQKHRLIIQKKKKKCVNFLRTIDINSFRTKQSWPRFKSTSNISKELQSNLVVDLVRNVMCTINLKYYDLNMWEYFQKDIIRSPAPISFESKPLNFFFQYLNKIIIFFFFLNINLIVMQARPYRSSLVRRAKKGSEPK